MVVKYMHISMPVYVVVVIVVVVIVMMGIVVRSVVVSFIVSKGMVGVMMLVMTSLFDLLWVWNSSCGNWNINVLGLVGHWLVIGMVGNMSYWFPVNMDFLVVNWLILCLSSIILVFWLWSVMVWSRIMVVF